MEHAGECRYLGSDTRVIRKHRAGGRVSLTVKGALRTETRTKRSLVRETEAHSLVQQIGRRVYLPQFSVNGVVMRIRDSPDRDCNGSRALSQRPVINITAARCVSRNNAPPNREFRPRRMAIRTNSRYNCAIVKGVRLRNSFAKRCHDDRKRMQSEAEKLCIA